ncbi:FitA-like ribbon-helix-helix domain-containing protein [Methylobacterium oxalidis]|uniref:FitA-like ribbon-helix-helix domain-containing protein n=1 Tax=Methylobacterium oxalidis TaxID=944322 RepID=UPI00331524DF
MDEIVLRDLDQEIVTRLAERAAGNNRPIEQEIAHVLRQALGPADDLSERRRDAARAAARAREIAAMTPPGVAQTDSVLLIREDRDR